MAYRNGNGNGYGHQQQQQQYPQHQQGPVNDGYDDGGSYYPQQQGPYASVGGNPSTYSVNTAGGGGNGHGHAMGMGHGDVTSSYADMYDDGERSPLTANAQNFAGYPPVDHNQGQGGYVHPGAGSLPSQPSYLSKDPYGAGGYASTTQDYLPPAGFAGARPGGLQHRASSANSDAEWQKRARMPTRGKTTKIKLTTQGTLSHDYPVPGPIKNSVEAKWLAMCAFYASPLSATAGTSCESCGGGTCAPAGRRSGRDATQ